LPDGRRIREIVGAPRRVFALERQRVSATLVKFTRVRSGGITVADPWQTIIRSLPTMNNAFKRTAIAGCMSAAALCAVSMPAHSSVIFTLGNTGGFDTINLAASSSPGTTITGTVNPVPQGNPTLTFTSSETLVTQGNGQSGIRAETGLINDLTIALANGGTFEGFVLNPLRPSSGGDLVVSVLTNTGAEVFDTATYGSTNGNNFLTVTTDALQSILSITVTSAGGFADFRQPRISFADAGGPRPPAEIAEPGTVALLGLALGAVAWSRRRTERREKR
jgi:hypothetical protein